MITLASARLFILLYYKTARIKVLKIIDIVIEAITILLLAYYEKYAVDNKEDTNNPS